MHIRKILCPTDLSVNSISGIACALSLARDHQADLVVFHVTSFPLPPLSTLYTAEMFPCRGHLYLLPTVDQVFRETTARVNAFMSASLGGHLTCRWNTRVSMGNVTKEIVDAACHEEADLIVMAKRHRGILSRMFSQSISEQVSRHAPCPVLSVCPPKIVRPSEGKRWPAINRVLQGSEA